LNKNVEICNLISNSQQLTSKESSNDDSMIRSIFKVHNIIALSAQQEGIFICVLKASSDDSLGVKLLHFFVIGDGLCQRNSFPRAHPFDIREETMNPKRKLNNIRSVPIPGRHEAKRCNTKRDSII
jgi:hypothetical protein